VFCVGVQYMQCSVFIFSIYSVLCWCPVYTVFCVNVQYIQCSVLMLKVPSPSPHHYPRWHPCQAPIFISTQLPTITAMSRSHLHLHTITCDLSHVKVPSPSPHNYMRSQLCQASIWDLNLEQLPMITAILSSHIYTSPHNYPWSQLCQGSISISTQLHMITVMSSSHVRSSSRTITHDHNHVKLPSLSSHKYPRAQSCQAPISISTQLPTIKAMSSFHLHTITHDQSYVKLSSPSRIITHDHSHVKLPSPSPHNYPRSQPCQALISITTELPTITVMSSSHLHL
jgi:hypothetical protein